MSMLIKNIPILIVRVEMM